MTKSHKSNRSLAKRIKVTSSGKVVKRKPQQNHFNAKDSGVVGLRKHGFTPAPEEYLKDFRELLPSKNIAG